MNLSILASVMRQKCCENLLALYFGVCVLIHPLQTGRNSCTVASPSAALGSTDN